MATSSTQTLLLRLSVVPTLLITGAGAVMATFSLIVGSVWLTATRNDLMLAALVGMASLLIASPFAVFMLARRGRYLLAHLCSAPALTIWFLVFSTRVR